MNFPGGKMTLEIVDMMFNHDTKEAWLVLKLSEMEVDINIGYVDIAPADFARIERAMAMLEASIEARKRYDTGDLDWPCLEVE
jgi:tryptophan 2,3-dioxygenase